MKRGVRWGSDVAVPLLLVGLYASADVAVVRYLALAVLAQRLVAFLYACLTARAITVTRTERQISATRFAEFKVVLTVRNRLPLPVHYLRVSDRAGAFVARSPTSFAVGLGPFEQRQLSYTLEGHQRGVFQLGPIDIAGTDALGLFHYARQIAATAEVLVYPSLFTLDLVENTGLPSGNLHVGNRLFEDVTRFRSIREYQPGDELKRINWKASARLNKLFTMEYEPSIYFPALVLLNLTDADYPQTHKQHLVERAIEMAGSLLFFCVGLKQEVGLLTSGTVSDVDGVVSVPIRPGYGHATTALGTLARVSLSAAAPQERVDFSDLVLRGDVAVPTGTRILVVSPPLKAGQVSALIALRRRGFGVEVFLVSSQSTSAEALQVPGLTSHRVSGYGKAMLGG